MIKTFSSVKITVFYIIYYSFLTLFFMLMLFAFFATLDDKEPSWDTTSNGIIGKNPGVGFRPMPPEERLVTPISETTKMNILIKY